MDVVSLGSAGHAWKQPGGSVCVLMANRAGGCGQTFNKPVLLFLTGTRTLEGAPSSQRVTGLVPNAVKAVTLVTDVGDRIGVEIDKNAFDVAIPATASIVGVDVTLAGGRTFFNAEQLGPPRSTRSR